MSVKHGADSSCIYPQRHLGRGMGINPYRRSLFRRGSDDRRGDFVHLIMGNGCFWINVPLVSSALILAIRFLPQQTRS